MKRYYILLLIPDCYPIYIVAKRPIKVYGFFPKKFQPGHSRPGDSAGNNRNNSFFIL